MDGKGNLEKMSGKGELEFELLAVYWIRCDGDFWLELGKRKQFKHPEWVF